MRAKFLLLVFCVLGLSLNAQLSTMNMTFGGKARQFMVYVPSIYNTQAKQVPLLFSLHGMGDNMQNFSGVGFHQIADTANFIVCTPQALTDTDPLLSLVGPAWNSGASMFGFSPNAGVDDVGFLMAIVDTLSKKYMINPDRIYSAGFSMGAYMTNRLACEKGDVIAAIGTVAGTIGNNLSCNPYGPMPEIHFHGTADQNVSYAGNQSGLDAEELVAFWVDNNKADTSAQVTAVPNIANDGLTIEKRVYPNTVNGAEVEFFKVNGADHIWLFTPQNDISYSKEIWRFLSKHSNIQVGREEAIQADLRFEIWPVPSTSERLNLDFSADAGAESVRIIDATGKVVLEQQVKNPGWISVGHLSAGVYTVQLSSRKGQASRRWIKF